MQVAIVPELFFHAAFIFIPAPHITSPLEASFLYVRLPTQPASTSIVFRSRLVILFQMKMVRLLSQQEEMRELLLRQHVRHIRSCFRGVTGVPSSHPPQHIHLPRQSPSSSYFFPFLSFFICGSALSSFSPSPLDGLAVAIEPLNNRNRVMPPKILKDQRRIAGIVGMVEMSIRTNNVGTPCGQTHSLVVELTQCVNR